MQSALPTMHDGLLVALHGRNDPLKKDGTTRKIAQKYKRRPKTGHGGHFPGMCLPERIRQNSARSQKYGFIQRHLSTDPYLYTQNPQVFPLLGSTLLHKSTLTRKLKLDIMKFRSVKVP